MQEGRIPGKSAILGRLPAGNVLVSRSALGKRIKAEFGYDDRIGVGACDRGPSGLESTGIRADGEGRGAVCVSDAKALVCDRGPPRPQLGTQCYTSATSLR